MTQLSPAAQAVLDAIKKELDEAPWDVSFLAGVSASAVLHIAADRVVPVNGSRKNNEIRAELLAIATELKGQ